MSKSKYVDLSGTKFGRLSVIKLGNPSKRGRRRWVCKCDCGKETLSDEYQLKKGITKSCGCYSREKIVKSVTKHGMNKTKLHKTWEQMRKRCRLKTYEHYDKYGGRGIKVCEEWDKDFIPFRDWSLANGYEEGLEIGRIDVNGNYEPSNCRFVTKTENIRNRTNTIKVVWLGKEMSFAEWCEMYGIRYKWAWKKRKDGCSLVEILTTKGIIPDINEEDLPF